MAISHTTVKAPGEKLFAVADWNAAHAGSLNHLTELTNVGVNTHAQIDTHISNNQANSHGGNQNLKTTDSPQFANVTCNNITVNGITDHSKVYGQAYRTSTFTITTHGQWWTVGLSGGSNNLQNLTLGDFDAQYGDDTNNKLTVAYAGVYKISYGVQFYAYAGLMVMDCSRLIKNHTSDGGGTEIPGSVMTHDVSANTKVFERTVIVSLAADDYISLQVGTGNDGERLGYHTTVNIPAATNYISAIVTIEKIN